MSAKPTITYTYAVNPIGKRFKANYATKHVVRDFPSFYRLANVALDMAISVPAETMREAYESLQGGRYGYARYDEATNSLTFKKG